MQKSKQKGNRYERETVNFYKQAGFAKALRNLEFQAEKAEDGTDLVNTDPFLVQCKVGSHVPIKPYKFLEQVEPRKGCYPIVHARKDRKPSIVIMYEDDFKELLYMLKKNSIL
jgi:hypothetical protein